MVCVHTVEYYSAVKKNETVPFAMTWMEPESTMLSEISPSEKDKYHLISLICGIRKKQTKTKAKKERQRERDKPRNRFLTIENTLMVPSGEEGWGKRVMGI